MCVTGRMIITRKGWRGVHGRGSCCFGDEITIKYGANREGAVHLAAGTFKKKYDINELDARKLTWHRLGAWWPSRALLDRGYIM